MMQSIKTSEANRLVVTELTTKLGIGPENLIARIAFAYSIAQGKKLNISDVGDSRGKEYSSKVLFGDYLPFFVALVCQHYNIDKSAPDIAKYIKMHIDDGLKLIADAVRQNPNLPIIDFVVQQVDKGIDCLSTLWSV